VAINSPVVSAPLPPGKVLPCLLPLLVEEGSISLHYRPIVFQSICFRQQTYAISPRSLTSRLCGQTEARGGRISCRAEAINADRVQAFNVLMYNDLCYYSKRCSEEKSRKSSCSTFGSIQMLSVAKIDMSILYNNAVEYTFLCSVYPKLQCHEVYTRFPT
jgi:hypothetical protein